MLAIVSIMLVFSLNSCTIQGEKVCGIWNAKTDLGTMKLEITPWEGKFLGYLLEYQNGNETIKGAKEDEFVFITDLVFENDMYKNGKIYLAQNSEQSCEISLKMLDDNQIKAIYNCDGEMSEETWIREGHNINAPTKGTKERTEEAATKEVLTDKKQVTAEEEKEVKTSTPPTKTTDKVVKNNPVPTPKQNDNNNADTKPKSTFYVVGVHKVVDYNDMNALSKAVEELWNKTYNDDFSGKLDNVSDWEKMYVTYSNYDNPKGKMTVTIGYKVKNLSNIPSGLYGVTIPKNDYWSYPLSGNASDYEGEEWKQLEQVMAYRKKESVDFEVYSFDNNYNVTQADIWIASK